MTSTIHVVGAGLAGLAAALDLAKTGRRVTLHEASPKAGGRCRSYHDEVLGRRIDNGNHLILSGNAAVLDHARRIDAADRLLTLPEPAFPFADLASGARWTIRVPSTPLGFFRSDSRPPRVTPLVALQGMAGLMAAQQDRTVAQAVRDRGPMWRAFWEPFSVSVLNAAPERGSATLLRAALLRTFLRGAASCRPVLAPNGLGVALIDPAVELLRRQGTTIRFRAPLEALERSAGRVTALRFGGGEAVVLDPTDAVLLAVPPASLAVLLPDLPAPGPGQAILNAHFRVAPETAERAPPLLGLLGAQAQWVFRRGDVLSVTVSSAEESAVWSMERDTALDLLWSEVARALGLPVAAPLARRLLRERGATFDQSPAGAALRPATRTPWTNLLLAGDFIRTSLPATLEGAVLSGRLAAKALLAQGA